MSVLPHSFVTQATMPIIVGVESEGLILDQKIDTQWGDKNIAKSISGPT